MLSLQVIPFAWLALAIVLEVLANLLLKYSDGLRKRWVAAASIVCVLAAFTALAQAVKDIPLSMAYAIWGGFGILATVAMGWALFGQRLAGPAASAGRHGPAETGLIAALRAIRENAYAQAACQLGA